MTNSNHVHVDTQGSDDSVRKIDPPRPLSQFERELLLRLINCNQERFSALERQLQLITVPGECNCGCGSIDLAVGTDAPAWDRDRLGVPVEGFTRDTDGMGIHILLHVRHGRLSELEIFREDGAPLNALMDVAAIEVDCT